MGRCGVRAARTALALSTPLAESPPESHLRVALTLAGLCPVPQYEVRTASGRLLARVDLAFLQQRVAVEYDGRDAHSAEGAFTRDRQRQNSLVAAGWVVLRFTAYDLRVRRDAVLAEVLAAVRPPTAA